MRAFVLDGYGAIADHVRLAEIADPVPGPDDVLIEIHAASLNPIDFKIVRGDLKRVSKYQLPRPFGFDASRHRAVGGRAGLSKFKPGDAVFVARLARHDRHVCRKIALGAKSRGAEAGCHFTRGSRGAAARRADHAAGFARVRCEVRPADPDPCRLRRVGTFAVQYASISALTSPRPRVRRTSDFVASLGPTASLPMTAKTIFSRMAITISSTTRSAAHSPSTPSRW